MMLQYCRRSLLGFLRQNKRCLASSSAVYKSYSLDGKGWDILSGKTTRIGCASGFWGDSPSAAPQLVHGGNIDFLVFDYLSEITMSLLALAQRKMPEHGYCPDFVRFVMAPLLKDIKRKGIRVVSNAGGINPHACAKAIHEVAKKSGMEDLKIAVITGDNLIGKIDQNTLNGVKEMDSGQPLPEQIHSMNAYIGAFPIARALDNGADVVITGRCVDSALALGPLVHTFEWRQDNFDLLASGSLAGHLIECGAQSTGGILTDWQTSPDWDNIGYPIVECASDGKFIVTKPPNTGGIVTTSTVAEQLVYEIGDPQNYILPDVTCDFSRVKIEPIVGSEEDKNQAVVVTGATGKPPPNTYKVSATYSDGFRATAVCPVGGPNAGAKARRVAESIIKRTRKIFKLRGFDDYTRTHIQVLGSEETYGDHARRNFVEDTREGVLWLAVHHQDQKALGIFSMEVASAGTGMAPGLTGIVGGRPKPTPVLKLFSFLYPKDEVTLQLHVDEELIETLPKPLIHEQPKEEERTESSTEDLPHGACTFPLSALAHTRSGDKGNSVNIGVIARHPSYLPFIRAALTPEAVQDYFKHLFEESDLKRCQVYRYELPGINALNFVLKNSLGGGGVASLRSDPQGKALGQMLLDFKISNVPDITPSTVEPTTA
ncbi:uncharacterized protein LOC114530279 [Dendronephthya gigantea]|uniref:uncharacterized protein LOC114530279 n=1 Tax=Dendronephthya gigantea TaxID=151771 RepID=UPI0010698CCE|nr:uncharacterized protein LOC114530279 [Dendronephthya gigantea]